MKTRLYRDNSNRYTNGPLYTPCASEIARDYVPPNPHRRNYQPPTEPSHRLVPTVYPRRTGACAPEPVQTGHDEGCA